MNIKRNFIPAFLILVSVLSGCKGPKSRKRKKIKFPPPKIGVMQIKKIIHVPVIESIGKASPVREVKISVERPGKLMYLPFTTGEVIKKGKLLARVRSLGLWSQHSQAKARISEIKTALAQARRDFNKIKKLYKSGALTKRDLELAQTQYESRKAQYSSAKAGLSQIDENLYGTTVFAPFTGKVAAKYQTEGNFVNMGMPLLSFVDLSVIKVVAGVSEMELKSLREGDIVEIRSISFPGVVIQGSIFSIAPVTDPQSGAYPVEVRFRNIPLSEIKPGTFNRIPVKSSDDENPDKGGNYWAFKGGMILKVRFFRKPVEGYFIPAESIVERNGKKWVVSVGKSCLDGKTAVQTKLTEIVTGMPYNEWFLIKHGIKEGDVIAVSGHTKLRRGSKVLCSDTKYSLETNSLPSKPQTAELHKKSVKTQNIKTKKHIKHKKSGKHKPEKTSHKGNTK